MSPITLPDDFTQRLSAAMKSSDAVELPFPAVYAWVRNGEAAHKQNTGAPALYYGGWAAKAEQVDDVCRNTGRTVPVGWAAADVTNRDNSDSAIYSVRAVTFAPIAKRVSWIMGDGSRRSHYTEGGRQHMQLLAYAAERLQDGSLSPWGPVVLTAKGYQSVNLSKALKEWEQVTAAVRSQAAPGIPAWCFYMAVGTFGKERIVEQVGKGAKSPVTPINLYKPETITAALVEKLFVGEGVAAAMIDCLEQAQEWLKAWGEEGLKRDGATAAIPATDEYDPDLSAMGVQDPF